MCVCFVSLASQPARRIVSFFGVRSVLCWLSLCLWAQNQCCLYAIEQACCFALSTGTVNTPNRHTVKWKPSTRIVNARHSISSVLAINALSTTLCYIKTFSFPTEHTHTQHTQKWRWWSYLSAKPFQLPTEWTFWDLKCARALAPIKWNKTVFTFKIDATPFVLIEWIFCCLYSARDKHAIENALPKKERIRTYK